MCVERGLYPLTIMTLERLRSSFPTIRSLTDSLSSLRPGGRRVAAMVTAEVVITKQERVVQFLRKFLRSADNELLRRFLRYSSGSDVVNIQSININFKTLTRLVRTFDGANTCLLTFDLPTTCISYNEFAYELRRQLKSDS